MERDNEGLLDALVKVRHPLHILFGPSDSAYQLFAAVESGGGPVALCVP